MKIAHVSTWNFHNVEDFCGSQYYVARQFDQLNIEQQLIHLRVGGERIPGRVRRILHRFRDKRHLKYCEPSVVKGHARKITTELRNREVDLIFSYGSFSVAYLETDKPLVFWADTPFSGLSAYPDINNACEDSRQKGNAAERAALGNTTRAIYATRWAADLAIRDYGVDEAKLRVVPWGANFEGGMTFDQVKEASRARDKKTVKLLLLGRDWERKGGDAAVAVVQELNRRGIPAQLTVAGCTPPSIPEHVLCVGYISKKTPEGLSRIIRLLRGSHFLIQPSKAETYGIAFAEANSFGTPSLASNVAGITSVIS